LLQIQKEKILDTFYSKLNTSHLQNLINNLLYCFKFIINAIKEDDLVEKLLEINLIELLIDVLSETVKNLFEIINRLELDENDSERKKVADDILLSFSKRLIEDYLDLPNILRQPLTAKGRKILESLIPLISIILQKYSNREEKKFIEQIPFFYPLLCELIASKNNNLRDEVKILLLRIGDIKIGPYKEDIKQ